MDELRKQVREMVDKFADQLITLTVKEGNRMTVLRLREARQRARLAAGGREGRIPYGEHPQFPGEKEALDFMINLRKKGHPYRIIAEQLERHDFKTRKNGNWNPGTVLRILRQNGIA
jgi:hypothetical protein